jgi:hypothetical protein
MKKADMIKELEELLVILEKENEECKIPEMENAYKIGRTVGVIRRILKK